MSTKGWLTMGASSPAPGAAPATGGDCGGGMGTGAPGCCCCCRLAPPCSTGSGGTVGRTGRLYSLTLYWLVSSSTPSLVVYSVGTTCVRMCVCAGGWGG